MCGTYYASPETQQVAVPELQPAAPCGMLCSRLTGRHPSFSSDILAPIVQFDVKWVNLRRYDPRQVVSACASSCCEIHQPS